MLEFLGCIAFIVLLVCLFRNKREMMTYDEYKRKYGSFLDRWD